MPCPTCPSLSRKCVGHGLTCGNALLSHLSQRILSLLVGNKPLTCGNVLVPLVPPTGRWDTGTPPRGPSRRHHQVPGHHPMKGTPMNEPQEQQQTDPNQPPVTKYVATIRLRANTHEELRELVQSLDRNWWHHHVDYGQRDQVDSTDGRTSVALRHTNPEQTPERYLEELHAWSAR